MGVRNDRPAPAYRIWAPPAVALVSICLGVSALVYLITLGNEIADDPPSLLRFARHPFVLWGDYEAAGLGPRWGAFPPLLPLVFGLLVAPWTWGVSDFWAIRLGILGWTLVAFALLYHVLRRSENTPPAKVRPLLWLFALLPSVWGAVALNPQDEIYVASYPLLLYAAATSGRGRWVLGLLVLTALAAKYFLLILAVPLALWSKRPLRNLILFGSFTGGTLVAYVAYHYLLHGLTPIIGYSLDSSAAISVWGLLWNLGITLPPHVLGPVSVMVCAATVLGFCLWGRRVDMPLSFLITTTLTITVLTVSIAMPAYILWAIPIAMICLGRIESLMRRGACAALLFSWGISEWGANLVRGLKPNIDRVGDGKGAVVEYVLELAGPELPLEALHIGLLFGVLLSGVGLITLLALEASACQGRLR